MIHFLASSAANRITQARFRESAQEHSISARSMTLMTATANRLIQFRSTVNGRQGLLAEKNALTTVIVLVLWLSVSFWLAPLYADDAPRFEYTPYDAQKVVYEFYFDHPAKISAALYWLRTHLKTLDEKPYDIAPDFLDIKVVMHGTEIVTLAKKNYLRYQEVVQRMRYYADLGVDFRVCALSLEEFNYAQADMQDFVTIIPSAITDLAHWQNKGYALIIPRVFDKNFTLDELE